MRNRILVLLFLMFILESNSYCQTMTIGGSVWGELDGNSIKDSGEIGGNLVQLELSKTNGTIVATTTADVNGNYEFNDVESGVYYIKILASNFNSGGPLYGLISCDEQAGDTDVDNDDNGEGEAPTITQPLQFTYGQEPEAGGTANHTVDFCFKSDCDILNPLAAPSCAEVTDTICNLYILDGFCSRMPSPPLAPGAAPNPLCSEGGTPTNMSWFTFVAGSGNYTLETNIFGCIGGQNGGQIGLIEFNDNPCDFTNYQELFCKGNPCVTGNQVISSDLLIPGQVYHLWLNGCGGSVCSYQMQVNGIFMQYQTPEIQNVVCSSSFGRCDTICPNNSVTFEAIGNYDDIDAKYHWRVQRPDGVPYEEITNEKFFVYNDFNLLGIYNITLNNVEAKCSGPVVPFSVEVVVDNNNCVPLDCNEQPSFSAIACGGITDTIYTLTILDSLCFKMPSPPLAPGASPNPLCAEGGAPHNMSWIAFMGGSGSYSLDLDIFGCTGGQSSVQMGVYKFNEDPCDFSNYQEIFCKGNPCVTGVQSITSALIIPGEIYHLWLDGCSGSVCSYEIKLSGDYQPFKFHEVDSIACYSTYGRCDTICINNPVTFELFNDFEEITANYHWSIMRPDSTIVYDTTRTRFMTYDGFNVNGNYTITLTKITSGPLQMLVPYSVNVVVNGYVDNEDWGDWQVCETELVNGWKPNTVWNSTVTNPNNDAYGGWYGPQLRAGVVDTSFRVTLPNKCKIDQHLSVTMLTNDSIYVDSFLCQGADLIINNPHGTPNQIIFPYNPNGYENLNYTISNAMGCDSILYINAHYINNKIQNFTLTSLGTAKPNCPNEEVVVELKNNSSYQYNSFYWNIKSPTGIIENDTTLSPSISLANLNEVGKYEVSMVKVNTNCGNYDYDDLTLPLLIESEATCNKLRFNIRKIRPIDCGNIGYAVVDISGGTPPFQYFVDGNSAAFNDTLFIDDKGFHTFKVIDSTGLAREKIIFMEEIGDTKSFDLSPNFVANTFRRGFENTATLIINNESCRPVNNVQAFMTLPPEVEFISSVPKFAFYNANTRTLNWDWTSLEDTAIVHLKFKTVLTSTIGQTIHFNVDVLPKSNDSIPANNTKDYSYMVMGSFDPNDLSAYPAGKCDNHYIDPSTTISYTARFQNIGNYPAQFVYIDDTLSDYLDINSLQILASSHNYYVEKMGERILRFHFPEIYLLPNMTNEVASHGYIIFELKPKSGLANNTIIKNKVGIVFDYNEAVVTNEVTHTLSDQSETIDVLINMVSNNNNRLVAFPGYTNYKWYDCSNDSLISQSTSNIFVPTYSGEFRVEVENKSCRATSTCISFITATNDIIDNQLLISPNPTSGIVTIKTNLSLTNAVINVTDVLGRRVFTDKLHTHMQVDFSKYGSGAYMIEVVSGERRVSKVVVVR